MDPASLIPLPDPLQVPWGWFQFLLTLTLVLHLLLMNAMLGGGIILLSKELAGQGRPDPVCHDLGRGLTFAIALTVNLGVAPLLFLQILYGQFIYVSSIMMGRWWLAIIAMLIVAYYLAYLYKFRFESLAGLRPFVLAGSLSLLLLIGFLFTNNMTLMLQPDRWPAYFRHPDGSFLNLTDPTLIPRYLHFVAGSVAVAGLLLALLARFRPGLPPRERQQRLDNAMAWFTNATMVEVGVGIVFFFSLPPAIHQRFLGGSPAATLLFLASLAGSVLCLLYGARRQPLKAAAALLTTLILMTLVRDLVRRAYLQPYFAPADLPLQPQYAPMLLFFAFLVAGLVLIGFMLRAAWRAANSEAPS